MRRLASSFFLAALTLGSAPTADAQAATRRDGPLPVADYVSLLDRVLYGDWDDSAMHVLFGPANGPEPVGAYVLRDEAGATLGSVPLKIRGQRSGTVATSVTWSHQSGPLDGIPNANGSLVLDLEFEGAIIGSVPYTQTTEQVGNAFDSRTVTRMAGPWQTHGYFYDDGEPTSRLHFGFWTTSGERAPAEVIVLHDGLEVAFGERRERVPETSRSFFRVYKSEFRGQGLNDDKAFTRSDVTPGGLEVVVLDDEGNEMRRFDLEGGDGTFVPHPRSMPGYEPHARSLAPRHAPRREQGLVHLFWTAPE